MRQDSRARRTVRWTALAVVVLVALGAALRSAQKLAEAGPLIAANRVLLTFLTALLVILALGFVGVLIRNLVRLILDRKRGILGSKLRTKMVFFFLALVLLPALLLSYGAASFLKVTVDALLGTPVEEVVREARLLVKDQGKREEASTRRLAQRLAEDLGANAEANGVDVATLTDRLDLWARREAVDVALIAFPDGRRPFVGRGLSASASRRVAIEEAALAIARVAREEGAGSFRVEPIPGGFLVGAGAIVEPAGDAASRGTAAVAVVGSFVPSEAAGRMDRIAAGQSAFERFRTERRDLLRLYYSLIALIGMATVFVATWIGFTLARRITVPIQEVASATREIASGNLGVRVRAEAGDEVGTLVDSFNEMASQLQESREVISRSTAELRRANLALEERRRYVETLVASLSSGVLSVDTAGRVTMANPAVEAILGVRLKPGDLLESHLEVPGLRPVRVALEEGRAESAPTGRHALVLQRAGSPVSVSIQVEPLRGGRGENLGSLLLVEDVTDLLRAQKALAWHEVARRIAHEIKNPLTPIQLSAQRLRKKFAEGTDDFRGVVESATASIEQEVGALKRLVDEFSRYARMPEPFPEPVDLAEIVSSVVSLYGGHDGMRWSTEVDPLLGPVLVDREQMRRVLINLLDNAVAATHGRGRVRIAARRWSGPGSLRLEVEDDGPGVPPAHRDRLFEPYFSTKRRGTGLGLAIVHRIVTEHRGAVRMEEPEGGGVRFVVEIPGETRDRPETIGTGRSR